MSDNWTDEDWRATLAASEGLREDAEERVRSLTAQVVERDAVIEGLHSWDGLMELLDEHWPEEFLPTVPDSDKRDSGPRIVSLLRWTANLQAIIEEASQALATEIIPFGDSMWRTWDKKIFAARAVLSQAPRDALVAHDKTVRATALRDAAKAADSMNDPTQPDVAEWRYWLRARANQEEGRA